jgi:hypothetical protein
MFIKNNLKFLYKIERFNFLTNFKPKFSTLFKNFKQAPILNNIQITNFSKKKETDSKKNKNEKEKQEINKEYEKVSTEEIKSKYISQAEVIKKLFSKQWKSLKKV